jgi:hypothetical protein
VAKHLPEGELVQELLNDGSGEVGHELYYLPESVLRCVPEEHQNRRVESGQTSP